MPLMQRALSLIYPEQCVLCPTLLDQPGALCPDCWSEMPFIQGLACHLCGAAMPGETDGFDPVCDDCIATPRPWQAGASALRYSGAARRFVLRLKHSDRTDLARPAAGWMARAGRRFLTPDTLLLPIPLHWTRLLRRRYNQSAELVRHLENQANCPAIYDGLIRTRPTTLQDGMDREARARNLKGAITYNPKHHNQLKNRRICLVDDVMTTGATLTEAANACHAAGATHISVLALARVAKDT